MSNYKVKVNNEAESKEVQGLFEQLGYDKGTNTSKYYPKLIITSNWLGRPHSSGADLLYNEVGTKELTTQQLRDLVVLKRNDKNDRNVIDPKDDSNLYLDSNNNLFVFHLPTQTWKESKLNGEEETMKRLKPITKQLKEYLIPQNNGKYALTKATEKRVSDWVEVTNSRFNFYYTNGIDFAWTELLSKNYGELLWQRYTQPEELPFVDDVGEPLNKEQIEFMKGRINKSLNTTYTEIERVRTAEQINKASMHHIIERGKTYDSEAGERSAHKTALAFNAITGHNLNESEVFLLLQILKDVRQWSKAEYHQDSAEDSISYAVLKSEALERNK